MTCMMPVHRDEHLLDDDEREAWYRESRRLVKELGAAGRRMSGRHP